MAFKWYFIRCQSGREKRIRDNALHRIKVAGVEDVIPQVVMPFKIMTDMKRGKKRTVEEKLYPGYLMVQADLENPEDAQVIKARTILRGIDGLRDFLGAQGSAWPPAGSHPGPARDPGPGRGPLCGSTVRLH